MNLRQDLTGCERYFIALKQVNGNAYRYKAFPVKCDRWDCPVCSKIKAYKYRKRISPFFERGGLYLYTLTFYHDKPPHAVWTSVSRAWNRFRTAAVKEFGPFSYVRVLEHHKKSPYPHLHIIADKLLPATWLGPEAVRAGFGFQINCKPITSEGAGTYVTKYLTKPWTDDFCRSIRKSLKLRIVTFGGCIGRLNRLGGSWDVLARCIAGDAVVDTIATDVNWTIAEPKECSFVNEQESYFEQTWIIVEGHYDNEEINKLALQT